MRLLPILFLMLVACERSEQVAPPTADESRRLDHADAMLDKLANETGPENAFAPSDPDQNNGTSETVD